MSPQPAIGPVRRPRQLPGWIALFTLTLVAGMGRLLWLEWQPLWWDEGYTVYFATEPLHRMAWLTAHDIHPPLYFALLHLWVTVLDSYGPVAYRTFSVLSALPAIPLSALLMRRLLGPTWRIPLLVAALLAINPMHLFYSQEVRMYGLALTFSLLATLAIIDYAQSDPSTRTARRAGLMYVLWASLALYTLYYTAFLFLAHFAWLAYSTRQAQSLRKSKWWTVVWPYLAIVAAYGPWLLYAGPKLFSYVQSKVAADEDSPLTLVSYIWQHGLAFSGGHLEPDLLWLQAIRYLAIASVLVLLAYVVIRALLRFQKNGPADPRLRAGFVALAFYLVVPLVLGFLVNLVYPFFPVGGERLLFYTLPYATGLLAISSTKTHRALTTLVLGSWIAASLTGVATFYSLPRYTTEDYRPVVRAVLENGRPRDQVLAIFPWQIGYWRAYAPRVEENGHSTWLGPQPAPLDQDFLEWNATQQGRTDAALDAGTLWFPAPLGFGSTLPHEIEAYLRAVAANAYNVWYSPTIRLSAWTPALDATPPPEGTLPLAVEAETPDSTPPSVAANLLAVHIGETAYTADNSPIVLRLYWQIRPSVASDSLHRVELALTNVTDGRTWAARSYQPLGHYSAESSAPVAENSSGENSSGEDIVAEDNVALIVPPGIPPGEYRLRLGVAPVEDTGLLSAIVPDVLSDAVSDARADVEPSADHLNRPQNGQLAQVATMQEIATVQITMPSQPVSPWRLPAQTHYDTIVPIGSPAPLAAAGLQLWSVTGLPRPTSPQLAGTNLATVFHLATMPSPPNDANLVAEVRAADGTPVAHTSVPVRAADSPTTGQTGMLISQPVELFLPGYLQAGSNYTLWAGIVEDGEQALRAWGTVPLVQRPPNLERPSMATELETPVQFGTHVMLLGYTLNQSASADASGAKSAATSAGATLALHWQILQPLVPPHHIFAHLVDADNTRIAQQDGEPVTVDGPAPTGTWQPDEYLTTYLTLTADEFQQAHSAQVGIYEPVTEVRLPAAQDSNVIGDYFVIPLNSTMP